MMQMKRNSSDTQMPPLMPDPGDTAIKYVKAVCSLLGVAVMVIALIGHFDWVEANGLWIILGLGSGAIVLTQWPRILKHVGDFQDRRAKRKREDELNTAQARHLDAKAEEIRAAAQIKAAEAWQKANSLPFDPNGNLAHYDHLARRVNYIPGKAPEFPQLTHNAPRYSIHEERHAQEQGELPAQQGRQLALPAPQGIPALYDLTEAFRRVDITPESIFLARTDQGEHLTVDGKKELCHGVFNAIPGKGKTIVERGLASQLLHAEYTVTFLDLKFALVTEDGLDYRPLAKKMWAQPPMRINVGGSIYEVPHIVRNEDDIEAVLHFLAYDEIESRLRMRDAGDFSFPTHFFFLDDMLAFMQQHPEAAEDLIRVLTLGRELRLKFFTAAQNFQNKETKLSGGAKSIFETAYFLGGDTYSGAKVLDIPERDLKEYLTRYQVNLGKGLTLLRNNTAAPNATLARVGMASNNAIYYHHGRADDFRLPPRSEAYTLLGSSAVVDSDTSPQQAIRTTGPLQSFRHHTSALTLDLQEALNAYQPGMSYRDLGKALGIGKDAAGQRLRELQRRGLLNK